jgi:hypothetical protein
LPVASTVGPHPSRNSPIPNHAGTNSRATNIILLNRRRLPLTLRFVTRRASNRLHSRITTTSST